MRQGVARECTHFIAFQELLVTRAKMLRRRIAMFQTHAFSGNGADREARSSSLLFRFRRFERLIITGTGGLTGTEKMLMRGMGFR